MNKKEIAKTAMAPLSLVNAFLKKREDTILIYANLGFRDNAKALYDYLIENKYNESYHIICAINEYRDIEAVEENVEFISPSEGMRRFFTAKYVFYTFGQYPIKPAKDQVVVHMWHGMPLKRIGNLQKGHENAKHNYFTYMVATSDFFAEIMQRCFKCSPNQILKTVQPKCDCLKPQEYDKLSNCVLWLPTYRNTGGLDFDSGENVSDEKDTYGFASIFKTKEDWKKLDDHLQKIGYEFIIKLHPLEKVLPVTEEFKNIVFMSEADCGKNNLNIYEVYKTTKALISDYSSSYMDYMLLDRPVAFILSDYEKYKERRGFVVDNPTDYMPGPMLKSVDDLCGFLDDVAEGKDCYREKRHTMNDYLNHYEIGKDTGDLLKKVGIVK
ncbi:MAG: CDP-glycerol glycerophosphotransferase family protein [Lachnospiraceae bacterium]|nr:CDP-glycerol glycerophosphotransferase family protein [Lachnospiraceae bacterium]